MTRFEDLKKQSPGVPEDTCDTIDPVINDIKTTHREVSSLHSQLHGIMNDLRNASLSLYDHTGDHGSMERLRSMNSQLRDSSYYWFRVAERLCKELAAADDRHKEVIAENRALRGDLTSAIVSEIENHLQPPPDPTAPAKITFRTNGEGLLDDTVHNEEVAS